jgi:hypothetical protein
VRPRAWRRAGAAELREQAETAAAAAVSGRAGAPVDVDVSVAEPAELLVAVSGEPIPSSRSMPRSDEAGGQLADV